MKAIRIVLAGLAAIAVQPFAASVWLLRWRSDTVVHVPLDEFAALAMIICMFATPFVLIVGVPSALLLSHHPRRGWWLAAIGFIAAALPIALLSISNIASISDLGPTVIFGFHGLAGAVAFHHALRALTPSSHAPPAKPSNVAVP